MALIKSISGIRGTIGGLVGQNLTPIDIVECTAAFGKWVLDHGDNPKIVVGRDARISGSLVSQLVIATLRSMGIYVVDIGLSTTPTVEMAVVAEKAAAGIILTASHNPKQWNALKLLNQRGEFISQQEGNMILQYIEEGNLNFATIEQLGAYRPEDIYLDYHVDKILNLTLVDPDLVKKRKFRVVVDCINSTGALIMPILLERLGCEVILINDEVNGHFAHNPEPLPDHLHQLSEAVVSHRADLGIAVDPDVDRLAFVSEDGEIFGEEYTLVAVADYVLQNTPGNTVSNLSSTRALKDVTEKAGGQYHASAVGEVNVVEKMKEVHAVIGGEGNGGVIYPELHYGRDAVAGTALFLTYLAKFGKSASFLRKSYPNYTISKNKIELTSSIDLDLLFTELRKKYKNEQLNIIDGLKIDFESGWIHLRRSNTEPIIRIYTESHSPIIAENLATKIKSDINEILKEESYNKKNL